MGRSNTGAVVASVAAELAPYAWRAFTARMLARRVVAAVDRHVVVNWLSTVPGVEVGLVDSYDPADAEDERVEVLAHALKGWRWRRVALERVCLHLVARLQVWHDDQELLGSCAQGLPDGL